MAARVILAVLAVGLVLATSGSLAAAQDGGNTQTTLPFNDQLGDDTDQTQVLGAQEQNTAQQDPPSVADQGGLAITGRSFGGMLGAGLMAVVVGGVLLGLSRRRADAIS